jgi:hypothetical protein
MLLTALAKVTFFGVVHDFLQVINIPQNNILTDVAAVA